MHRLLLSAAICGALACGGESGDPPDGEAPLRMESNYRLSCTIDTLVLELRIELAYALDQPYSEGSTAELEFSATVVFSEASASALIAAGVATIDIVSMQIDTWVLGAEPDQLRTTLEDAPINDYDLEPDTDENGIPGPHRLELSPISVTSTVSEGVSEVELGLSLDQISLILGDFGVPTDCVNPTLVGGSARFPVAPSN